MKSREKYIGIVLLAKVQMSVSSSQCCLLVTVMVT